MRAAFVKGSLFVLGEYVSVHAVGLTSFQEKNVYRILVHFLHLVRRVPKQYPDILKKCLRDVCL